jgi:hypothetical protein
VIIAISSDIKRKGVGEQQDEMSISTIGQTKTQRLDYDEGENDPNRRCVDLIVLGISYRSLEADVKKCFEAFGELIFCEVINSHQRKKNVFFLNISSIDQTRCQWTITWFWFYSI